MGCGASTEPYQDPYEGQAAVDPAFLARQQQSQMQAMAAQQQLTMQGQAMPMQPVPYGTTQAMAMQQQYQQQQPQQPQQQPQYQQQAGMIAQPMAQPQAAKAPVAGTDPTGWMQPAATVQKPLGSPAREFIMEGDFQWAGSEAVPNWQMSVFCDEAGNVFGGNRADKGFEMHYAGFITEQGINVQAVFESGMTLQYEASLSGGEVGVSPLRNLRFLCVFWVDSERLLVFPGGERQLPRQSHRSRSKPGLADAGWVCRDNLWRAAAGVCAGD